MAREGEDEWGRIFLDILSEVEEILYIVQLFIKIQIILNKILSKKVVRRLMPFIFYFKIHSFSQSKCKNANFLQTQNLSFSENLTFLYSILSRDLHEQLCKISAFYIC